MLDVDEEDSEEEPQDEREDRMGETTSEEVYSIFENLLTVLSTQEQSLRTKL